MRESMPMFHRICQKMMLAASLLIACSLALLPSNAVAQSAQPPATAPADVTYKGCVQSLPTDKETLVLSSDTVCARLTGKFAAADLAGHEVELKGVLTPRSPGVSASISVGSVVSVGKSCSSTCSLRPPGTRGLGKGSEKPGKEGGTPGLVPTQPPPH